MVIVFPRALVHLLPRGGFLLLSVPGPVIPSD